MNNSDFIEGVVKINRCPNGTVDPAGIEPGMHAVLTRANHDIRHLVQHDRHLVMVRFFHIKSYDPVSLAWIVRTDILTRGSLSQLTG